LDSQGNVWYLNGGPGFSQVGYIDEATFTVHSFGSTLTPNAVQPFGGLTLGADNAMWFTEESYPSVQQIGRITTPANGVAGTYTEFPDPNSGSSIYPTDITKGSDGKVWFSEFASNAANQFFANFVPGPSISINEFPNVINPNAFANLVTIFAGTDNNIWMAEGGGAVRITPSNPTNPDVEFFTDNGQTSMVNCISGTTPDGNLWCSAYGGPALGQGFIPTTDAILTWKPR
jgi:streptogramin lyase